MAFNSALPHLVWRSGSILAFSSSAPARPYIAHGVRNWFDRRGELKQDGQRISRHYYDLHCMLPTDVGSNAIANLALGADCIEHAKTFFNRPDFNLATAVLGSFALLPSGDMVDRLAGDYENTKAMIFGEAPRFGAVLESIAKIEEILNG